MPSPTSPEFLDLCQSQMALLTTGLGASLCAVYLAERVAGNREPRLIPIAIYPEEDSWLPISASRLLPSRDGAGYVTADRKSLLGLPQLDFTDQAANRSTPTAFPPLLALSGKPTDATPNQPYDRQAQTANSPPIGDQPIVVPLIHRDEMVGLLVTGRDRPWTDREQEQIEQIAHTLALACLLDQRSQLLNRVLTQQHHRKQQQTELFDTLLHQFRNPLTALRTFGKLLFRRLKTEDPNQQVADHIIQETTRLQELLTQFEQAIDLDRPDDQVLALEPDQSAELDDSEESPTIPIASPALLMPASGVFSSQSLILEACSVRDVLLPLVASASAIASDRALELTVDLPPTLPAIRANGVALREVLSNVLDNALKYTPSGGVVWIHAWSTQTHHRHGTMARPEAADPQASPSPSVTIAISDTGPGMPEQDLAHLFERHYRGVQAKTDIPGTGLGLAIAKDLVNRMQGEIHVISPALASPSHALSQQRVSGSGQGITVLLTLPRALD